MAASGVTAAAPGKIILSGEHAVVAGAPAFVTAVNRFVTATAKPIDEPFVEIRAGAIARRLRIPIETDALRRETWSRYDVFVEGKLPPHRVLEHPLDLIAVCWILFAERYEAGTSSGVHIEIRSDLPRGSGMGSSAAATVGTMAALMSLNGLPIDPASITELSHAAERFQHGKPSGVDSYVSTHGGCVRYQRESVPQSVSIPSRSFVLVDTGTPETTTGECVSEVQRRFEGSAIWQTFERMCNRIEEALIANDIEALKDGIRNNHGLLREIGVVPNRIDRFVRDVESAGGAAKVCGAGAVRGDKAGVLWVVSEPPPTEICAEYGYDLFQVEAENDGVRIIQ